MWASLYVALSGMLVTRKDGPRSRSSTKSMITAVRVRFRRGVLPSFHSFRHTATSEAIAAGESAEEISWQLGHKNSIVTRAVYIQEVKSAERTARRRARMEARYGPVLALAAEAASAHRASPTSTELVTLGRTEPDGVGA